MTQNMINKYRKYSLSKLKEHATNAFNEYIRLRDQGQKCISCDSNFNQAGHYYSAGHYPGLKFNEDNVNGQCMPCNFYKHGNLIEYRKKLILKIGVERLEKLDMLSAQYKRKSFKWSKIDLIDKIIIYRDKVKELRN